MRTMHRKEGIEGIAMRTMHMKEGIEGIAMRTMHMKEGIPRPSRGGVRGGVCILLA